MRRRQERRRRPSWCREANLPTHRRHRAQGWAGRGTGQRPSSALVWRADDVEKRYQVRSPLSPSRDSLDHMRDHPQRRQHRDRRTRPNEHDL